MRKNLDIPSEFLHWLETNYPGINVSKLVSTLLAEFIRLHPIKAQYKSLIEQAATESKIKSQGYRFHEEINE